MASMLIPERTVDSLFAADMVRDDPNVLIWSPTQYSGSPDHVLTNTSGRILVIEAKGVQPVGDIINDVWRARIDVAQLNAHASAPHPVIYLLLAKPDDLHNPSKRPCPRSCCARGRFNWCKKCARDARSWGLLEQHILSSPEQLRLQPWFAHWAWCIPAKDLQAQFIARKKKLSSFRLQLDDGVIQAQFPTANRLCHLFEAVRPSSSALSSWTWPPEATTGLYEFPASDDEDTTPLSCAVIPNVD